LYLIPPPSKPRKALCEALRIVDATRLIKTFSSLYKTFSSLLKSLSSELRPQFAALRVRGGTGLGTRIETGSCVHNSQRFVSWCVINMNRPLFVYFWSAFSPLLRAGWGVEVMGWVRVGILAVLLAVGGGEEDGGGSNDLQQSPGTALSREAARLYEEGVELCRRGGNAEACRAKMASSLHFDRNQVHPLGREIRTWASVCFQSARCRLPPPPP